MSTNRRLALFATLFAALAPQAAMARPTVTVFAAASLTDVMKDVAGVYQARTGVSVTLSFDASSILARQIDNGAQADIFMSADEDWMDYLQKDNRIIPGTRRNLLGNRLVLVADSDPGPIPKIAPHFDLAGALGDNKLAMADPASVPAGKYGKAALTALGVWDSVAPKVAQAESVRVALEYVARGEAPFGIVYATDARLAPVKVVGVFPENTHPPILYPVALTRTASPAARAFLAFLSGKQARAIFEKAGFTTLP
ncbi:MAG TPA: molybdate ABC transporter substrate-binding protein [Rhizomicrobium sp.]|nr:molybdate ABC transporter substrate-binding protein [Rhizomicrobium sp.]